MRGYVSRTAFVLITCPIYTYLTLYCLTAVLLFNQRCTAWQPVLLLNQCCTAGLPVLLLNQCYTAGLPVLLLNQCYTA